MPKFTSATAAALVQAHGSRLDTPQTSTCAPWCTRPHPDGFPVGYCESAPLATWDKAPGDVRTVTVVRFVPALADRVRSAEVIAVKGGNKPILFAPEEVPTLARVIGVIPGAERLDERAAELLAA